jgi:hypothetical protein
MGFHRNLKDLQKGEKRGELHCLSGREQQRRGEEKLLTEGEEEGSPRSPEHGRRRWPPVEIAGEREIARRRELGGWEKKQSLWLGSGWGGFFKTRDGHTGQSTVPVRCTPDSAQ